MQKTGMKPEDIKIDPELRDYLTPLSEEEEKQLTGALIYEGCLSPLIVEANTGVLLDGHNRYRICKEYNIPFQIKTLQITKKSRQIEFVITNQLSRRNLSKDALAKLVGDLYNMMKTRSVYSPGWQPGESGNPEGKKHARQNDEHANKQSAGEKVAKLAGVSKRTAEREGRLNEKIKQHNIPPGTPRKKAKEIIKEKEAPKLSAAAQAEEEEVLSLHVDNWLDDEIERKETVSKGQAVLANAERDKNLIQWAEMKGLAVRIDRRSPYGNPFILGKDGNRDEVCDYYKNQYLPYKASIKKELLRGKVLICHCYPERCHGESLIDAEKSSKTDGPKAKQQTRKLLEKSRKDLILQEHEFCSSLKGVTETSRINTLTTALKNEGCKTPLIVIAGTNKIIDGAKRYQICKKHGIPFHVQEMHFDTNEDIARFVIDEEIPKRRQRGEEEDIEEYMDQIEWICAESSLNYEKVIQGLN